MNDIPSLPNAHNCTPKVSLSSDVISYVPYYVFRVILQVPRILRWLLNFWKILLSMSYCSVYCFVVVFIVLLFYVLYVLIVLFYVFFL